MAQQNKEIASIEILHLDETGYGPEGKHTRREWREECLSGLQSSKENFGSWQRSVKQGKFVKNKGFGYLISYNDGTQKEVRVHENGNFLDYIGCYFDELSLIGSIFFAQASFEASIFEADIVFTNSIFQERVSFENVNFKQDAIFKAVRFSKYVDFSRAKFNFGAEFDRSEFAERVEFISVNFNNYVTFKSSKFNLVSFKNAVFFQGADFDQCTFNNDVNYSSAKFQNNVGFNNALFLGEVNFELVSFGSDVWFDDVEFRETVDFMKASFKQNVWFARAKFLQTIDFESCHFYEVSEFECAVFNNVGHVERAFFHTSVPNFRGCKIDGTCLEFTNETQFSDEDYDAYAIRRISFLKRLADHHGQVDQAIEFNAMELRAKRKYLLEWLERRPRIQRIKTGEWWSSHATWIYEHVSDFGRSFTTPLQYYLVLLVLTWIVALACAISYGPQLCQGQVPRSFVRELARYNTCENPDEVRPPKQLVFTGYTAASEYTLYRASGFIHFADKGKQVHDINRRLFNSPVEPWFMRLWGLVTSLLSTIFFFFIALGLRNRYRIK